MRLDRFLANMGYGTRTEIKIALKRCQIKLNGKIVKKPDMHIQVETDEVTFDDGLVRFEQQVYILMNKPQGVISATSDPRDKTVVDLLEPRLKRREVFPVGRLDKDTEGLLVLTDDGKLAHELLSPKRHVPKTYLVHCLGPITPEQLNHLKRGVEIEEGIVTQPAETQLIQQGEDAVLHLTIYEGKFHQVKRMLQGVGSEVTYLKRLAMGNLWLDETIALGDYRYLTEAELSLLRNAINENIESGETQ
jgi:16S rRNA pseudouridine516 synthase